MSRKSIATAVFLVLPLLLAVTVFGAGWYSRRPVEVGLVGGKLRACPDKPNCVNSDSDDALIEPLVFEGQADDALARLVVVVGELPGTEVLSVSGDYVHAVATTPVVGFADDLEFRLDRAAQRIHVRSASRVGYSDMGANQARVERLRALWAETGGSTDSGR